MVPWNPNEWMSRSISVGKMKLPAAVPDMVIPLARARRFSKYCDTITIPGVVDNPPPIPVNTPNVNSKCTKLVAK